MDVLTRCRKCLETMSSRASVALVESRVTIGLRVMIWLTGVVCGSRPSAVTYTQHQHINFIIACQRRERERESHPVCQILRGENPTKTLLIVNDENAVRALGSTQLTSLGYCDVFRHGKRGAGLEGSDGSLRRGGLSRAFVGAALVCGYGAFAGELGFDFLPDCLGLNGSCQKMNK